MIDAPTRTVRNCALDILSRREHSRTELRTKLIVREFLVEQIDALLDVLMQEGL